MHTRSRRFIALAGVLPLLVALGTALPASAREDGPSPTVDTAVAAVHAVAGQPTGAAHRTADGVEATSGADVVISEDPSVGTQIETASGHDVVIGVPGSDTVDGAVAGPSVVFPEVADDASVVSRPTPEGAQAFVVLDGPDAPTRFHFPITVDGAPAILRQDNDGAIDVLHRVSGQPVAYVAPPWAVDAAGRQVRTSYQVEGSTVVQIVHHRGANYPVVADPNTCGTVTCTYYFNKKQTRDLAKLDKAGAVCGFLYKYPIAAAGCFASAGVVAFQADRAVDKKMCLKIKYTRFGATVWWPDIYSGGHCR